MPEFLGQHPEDFGFCRHGLRKLERHPPEGVQILHPTRKCEAVQVAVVDLELKIAQAERFEVARDIGFAAQPAGVGEGDFEEFGYSGDIVRSAGDLEVEASAPGRLFNGSLQSQVEGR